jgi:hypothetical protein
MGTSMRLDYVILYVPDVVAAVEFHERVLRTSLWSGTPVRA